MAKKGKILWYPVYSIIGLGGWYFVKIFELDNFYVNQFRLSKLQNTFFSSLLAQDVMDVRWTLKQQCVLTGSIKIICATLQYFLYYLKKHYLSFQQRKKVKQRIENKRQKGKSRTVAHFSISHLRWSVKKLLVYLYMGNNSLKMQQFLCLDPALNIIFILLVLERTCRHVCIVK